MGGIDKKSVSIIVLGVLGCMIMILVESVIQPTYLYKSIIKISNFVLCLAIFCLYSKDNSIFDILKIKDKKQLLLSILMGMSVYCIILSTYVILKGLIDLDHIAVNLMRKEAVTKNNFIYIAIYISIVNSFLEEVFFRGFLFVALKKYFNIIFAYLFSSLMFALYHIAIISGWFSFGLFILLLLALTLAGVFFDYLDRKGTVYNSWAVHMFSNFAINTIGLMMFGLIG